MSTSTRTACPCLHTTPCRPRCTCVTPASSSGCSRCVSYGSATQRKARADFIAAAIRAAETASESMRQPGFQKRRNGLLILEKNSDGFKPPVMHEARSPEDAGRSTYLQVSEEPAAHTAAYDGAVLVDLDGFGRLRGVEFVGGRPLTKK